MIVKIVSGALLGVDAYRIDVEVHITRGLQSFRTVGLPEGAVREAKVRVKSAIENTELSWPLKHITVNLAPADIRKDGTLFDLPIALGILAASGQCEHQGPDWKISDFMIAGELSLDGAIKPIRGALSLAIAARDLACKALILPQGNAREASVVEGLKVLPVRNLREVVSFFRGELELHEAPPPSHIPHELQAPTLDFSEVKGQELARRALEIAAAGGHNVLMIGPPGSGKTMLARRIPSILPPLGFEEALETSKIYSLMGKLPPEQGLLQERPFRSPHHTISAVGLAGGGSGIPRPGEISLAHNGVLFLDELPEFHKRTLEVLRQPLEDQEITINRSLMSLTYPASVTLVASMNPCPCGYAGDARHACSCTPLQRKNYQSRLSGPLLDRIDIHIEVPSVHYKDLRSTSAGDSSTAIRERILKAREVQHIRFREQSIHCNAQMRPRELDEFCAIDDAGHKLMERVVDKLGMSARTFSRILKVARTIADLAESPTVQTPHLAEAVQYRLLDRQSNT